jgi:hypothetical protein
MVLRYAIELETRPTFTSSVYKENKFDLYLKVELLKAENKRLKRKKYTNFIIYDDENNIVEKIKT